MDELLIVSTGGTIDKVYFDDKSDYQVGDPQIGGILRELGVMPCASLAQVQETLDKGSIAFVPTAVLAPGLTDLLSLRARLHNPAQAGATSALRPCRPTGSVRRSPRRRSRRVTGRSSSSQPRATRAVRSPIMRSKARSSRH